MKNPKLYQLLAVIVGSSSLGAQGLACYGECPDPGLQTKVIPIPTIESDAGADAGMLSTEPIESLCSRYCYSSISCKPATITQPDGTSIPAFECVEDHNCYAGRRPQGMARLEVDSHAPSVAKWLAAVAHLEAASIDAFRSLRRNLRARGAPRSLLRQASRAARDEKRHARQMRSLAQRAGIACLLPSKTSAEPLSIEELALENAVEGCVRESFGSIIAQYQAEHSQDRDLAAAMKKIAKEESEHAALAYRIDAWAQKRLEPKARARIRAARENAMAELARNSGAALPEVARSYLGLPNACTYLALVQAMFRVLPKMG